MATPPKNLLWEEEAVVSQKKLSSPEEGSWMNAAWHNHHIFYIQLLEKCFISWLLWKKSLSLGFHHLDSSHLALYLNFFSCVTPLNRGISQGLILITFLTLVFIISISVTNSVLLVFSSVALFWLFSCLISSRTAISHWIFLIERSQASKALHFINCIHQFGPFCKPVFSYFLILNSNTVHLDVHSRHQGVISLWPTVSTSRNLLKTFSVFFPLVFLDLHYFKPSLSTLCPFFLSLYHVFTRFLFLKHLYGPVTLLLKVCCCFF